MTILKNANSIPLRKLRKTHSFHPKNRQPERRRRYKDYISSLFPAMKLLSRHQEDQRQLGKFHGQGKEEWLTLLSAPAGASLRQLTWIIENNLTRCQKTKWKNIALKYPSFIQKQQSWAKHDAYSAADENVCKKFAWEKTVCKNLALQKIPWKNSVQKICP